MNTKIIREMVLGFGLALGLAFETGLATNAIGATVVLQPSADTFLSEFSPDHNIGGHTNIAAGTVSNGTRTRALLRFDVGSNIPAGATVTRVSLKVTATRVNAGGGVASRFVLRRVLQPWNEGSKRSSLGAPASSGESTWTHRQLPEAPWAAPGGAIGKDFSSEPSAAVEIGGIGEYEFASAPGLVADVASWLAHAAENHGWVFMTELETTSETARRFASREDPARAPVLTVEFTEAAPFRISNISRQGNELVMNWIDGRPSYQLQMRSSLHDAWINVGTPTTATTASVPLNGSQAYFRVVQDFTARYQVVFNATWSQQTHPEQFPAGSAHWSGLVGGVHNERVHFWREGETASEGIRLMAELGSQPRLLSEVNAAISAGTAHLTLSGGGINPSPGSRLLVFPQPMRRDFPLVTLCSMVAPSPDWFVGVDSLSLIENDAWASKKIVTLFGHDAGTDSGGTYAAPDQVTVPRGVITRFTGFPALVNGTIVPFGTFEFTRLD
ncbi:MAG: spondin domain-containing protein [Verrucomicrobiota bacterium]